MFRHEDVIGMKMTAVHAKPPNWDAIIRVFPAVQFKSGVLFCYGDTIYNPNNVSIPTHLLAHECTHSLQQKKFGLDIWWDNYLTYPGWRLMVEAEAHRVEIEEYNLLNGRAMRRKYFVAVADRLAGPLYGNLTTRRKAKALLKEGHDDTAD